MSLLASISRCISAQPGDVGVVEAAAGSRTAPAAPAARASGRSRRPRAWSAAAPARPCSARARSAPRPPASAAPRAPAAGWRRSARRCPPAGSARRARWRRRGSRSRRWSATRWLAASVGGRRARRGSLSGSWPGRTPCRPGRTPARTACPTARGSRPSAGPRWALARRRLAEHGDAAALQIRHRGVEVVDVQRDVVAADVAVARAACALVGRGVLEHLEDRLAAAAEEVQLAHHRARVAR